MLFAINSDAFKLAEHDRCHHTTMVRVCSPGAALSPGYQLRETSYPPDARTSPTHHLLHKHYTARMTMLEQSLSGFLLHCLL